MAKPARVLGCCLLLLPLVGSVPKRGEQARPPAANSATLKVLQKRYSQTVELFRAGRYNEALKRYAEIRAQAGLAGYMDLSARALGNQGGCEFALHRYRQALELFLQAHQLAQAAGDTSAAAAFDANIGSLYAQMGELDAAVQWLQRGVDRMRGNDRAHHLSEAQIEMASLRARQNRWADAIPLFQAGLAGADRDGNIALLAKGYQRLGEERLRQGDLESAETALLEAYRVRKENHLPLEGSYCYLGKLRLEQKDYVSASALMDLAAESVGKTPGSLPVWDVYLTRGRIRLAQNRLREALDDLRIARRFANAWRWSLPADDTSRIGAESQTLAQVYDAVVESANRLYEETGDRALILESFEAAEENRANSLRALVQSSKSAERELPPDYWEAVARLQRAELLALRDGNRAARGELSAARAWLVRLDAAYVPAAKPLPADLGPRAMARLDGGTALLAFHLGRSSSWLWALERGHIELHRLPSESAIRQEIEALSDAVLRDSGEIEATGARLYDTLLGSLPQAIRRKERWLLALDTSLFEAPFAVMVDKEGGSARYLIEKHVLAVVPGVGYWLDVQSGPPAPSGTGFLAVGDPVYNLADSRLPAQLRGMSAPRLPLPRLVGSGAEIESCARSWSGPAVLLTGREASRSRLLAELLKNPSVVHFATHFLKSPGEPPSGLIALSLTQGGEPELVSGTDIAHWKTGARLVVLSGCQSAGSAAIAGTGLLGLTRSWLIAGARAVIGSRWATPDEEGTTFALLYRNLSRQPQTDPASALREAQLQLLRSGDFRSHPRFWGAYFAMGGA